MEIESYRVFSRDVTAAMLASLKKGTGVMLVSQTNPPGIEYKRFLLFWLKNILIDHVSENTLCKSVEQNAVVF